MNRLIFLLILLAVLIPEDRSSKEIQKDIDSRNAQLELIRKQIANVEKNIIQKTNEAISTTEILIDLENKISLTEKLIKSLNREERYLLEKIQLSESRIRKKENDLVILKEKLVLRLQYLYKYGRPSMLETLMSTSKWNDAIYRIKYLDILSENEQKLRKKIQNGIVEIEKEHSQLQWDLVRKKNLRNEKEIESNALENDKKQRRQYLTSINEEKNLLEKELTEKQRVMSEIENLVKKLFSNKTAMKKREDELARIRALQNMATKGNFSKMKGKLPWPVKGKVVSTFGTHKNKTLNTITENVGIDIKANQGTAVQTVFDGMVSTITFIRGHGNIVIIDHGGGYSTVYANIQNISVNENEYVQIGESFATVSPSQYGSNHKLHFEVWGKQQKLNPEVWLKK